MKAIINIISAVVLFSLTMTGSGQGLINNGAYIKATTGSYVTFGGSTDQSITSTTADRTEFYHLNVNFNGSGNYDLTINDDSYVTVDGNLTLSDSLFLEASSSGMASLITKGTVTGNYARVYQYLSQDQWHMVSSPVSSETIDVYSGIYLKEWDEPTAAWTYLTTPTTTPLNVTEGYAAWSSSSAPYIGATKVDFNGALNTGNQSVNLDYTTSSDDTGWNLIGNPYPSAIDWNSSTSWSRTNVGGWALIYDNGTNRGWNYSTSTGYNGKTDGIIPATQGFWVRATSSGASLTIPNSERTHDSQSFYKSGGANILSSLTLKAEGNSYSDEAIVQFIEDATEGFDGLYDLEQRSNVLAAPQFYCIIEENVNYAVNALPELSGPLSIPLGFECGVAGLYGIQASGMSSFDPSVRIYLEDLQSHTITNLKNSNKYSFEASPSDDPERFILHFDLPESPHPGNTNESNPDFTVFAFKDAVHVNAYNSEQVSGEVEIISILGQVAYRQQLENKVQNIIHPDVKPGYYLVRVLGNEEVMTSKVYIE